MVRLRVRLVMLGCMAPPILTQHHCPTWFDYAGTLKGSSAYGIAFDERREFNPPPYATNHPLHPIPLP